MPSILPLAQSRIEACYRETVGLPAIAEPPPNEAALAPSPIGNWITILMQVLTALLGGCGGGGVAAATLAARPLFARLRIRQAMAATGNGNYGFRQSRNLVEAMVLAGQRSTPEEMDQYLSETSVN